MIRTIDPVAGKIAMAFCKGPSAFEEEREIALPELLARGRLDFTVPSLAAVDEYLMALHWATRRMPEIDTTRTVVWCGAYVGEVIRRNAGGRYHWVDYRDYMAAYPQKRTIMPRTLTSQMLLCMANGAFTAPLTKVWCAIEEGPGNEVSGYARKVFTQLGPGLKRRWVM